MIKSFDQAQTCEDRLIPLENVIREIGITTVFLKEFVFYIMNEFRTYFSLLNV